MKFFVMAASLRRGSLNKKLASSASAWLSRQPGLSIDLADFREFELPVYDGDLEESAGVPEAAVRLAQRISAAQAVVISTPEYNGGMPGAFKNAIDWVSRTEGSPFDDMPLQLLSASPGALGGARSLWHSRVPLEALGAVVYPGMFGLSAAHQAFSDSGELKDPKTQARLESSLGDFLQFVRRLSPA